MDLPQPMGDIIFKCEICEKCFSNNQKKNKHVRAVHGEKQIFECNICCKTFTSAGILNNHTETNHKAQRNNKCDTCGKSFTQYRNLNFHIETIHEKKINQLNHQSVHCRSAIFLQSRSISITSDPKFGILDPKFK